MLSIIIPVYNTKEYLERCVSSLAGQMVKDTEVILVDDGSTDGSDKMCDMYADKYEWLKTIHKKNGGLASARNAGMAVAEGEYIAFLDSDDWFSEGTLETVHSVINEAAPDLIGFGCARTDGKVSFRQSLPPYEDGLVRDIHRVKADAISNKRLFETGLLRSVCMHVFRKDIIERSGLEFISERILLNEDYLFLVRYIMQISNYYSLRRVFYNYYVRENSLTTSYLTNMFERKSKLLDEYRKYIKADEEFGYRLKLFELTNCYECLANAMSEKDEVKKILQHIRDRKLIDSVRMNEQSLKAKIILAVMKLNNVSAYVRFYKAFKVMKKFKEKR